MDKVIQTILNIIDAAYKNDEVAVVEHSSCIRINYWKFELMVDFDVGFDYETLVNFKHNFRLQWLKFDGVEVERSMVYNELRQMEIMVSRNV